jgi:hypothetical protein
MRMSESQGFIKNKNIYKDLFTFCKAPRISFSSLSPYIHSCIPMEIGIIGSSTARPNPLEQMSEREEHTYAIQQLKYSIIFLFL